jgi:hypothetical protein
MNTNCLLHKYKIPTSNMDEENHYGNCICSSIEDSISTVDDEHQRRHHSRRASSASSSVTRSAVKRNRNVAPPRLSELCIRVLINSVSIIGPRGFRLSYTPICSQISAPHSIRNGGSSAGVASCILLGGWMSVSKWLRAGEPRGKKCRTISMEHSPSTEADSHSASQ